MVSTSYADARLDEDLMDAQHGSEVVRSGAAENTSFGSGVHLLCLYSTERLSDRNALGAISLHTACLVRAPPSTLETALIALSQGKSFIATSNISAY